MIDFQWQTKFGYYVTYFGDVYSGIAVSKDVNGDDFFVVSKNQFIEFNELQGKNKQAEHLERLGTYIPSKDIIQKWIDFDVFRLPEINSPDIPWSGNPNTFKKMYVFGAGASANCLFGEGRNQLRDSSLRPPLGTELFASRFDELICKYPGLKMILPKFESKGNDIEAILEEDWSLLMKGLNKELAAQHIQLQFFLQELFELISQNYSEKFFRYSLPSLFVQNLANQLNSENKAMIVSFNYDTILDNAFENHYNMHFGTINQYVMHGEKNHFLFYKPHGSWNWGWEFDENKLKHEKDNIVSWLYKNKYTPATIYYNLLGGDMLTNEGWGIEASNHQNSIGRFTPNRNKIKVRQVGKYYFPALLLPYRDKDEFVMPYNQQIQMEYTLPHIEELVLIGWKGNEKLFNTKLKNKATKLKKITIANPMAEDVKTELDKYLDLSEIEIDVVKDFEDYVLNYMK